MFPRCWFEPPGDHSFNITWNAGHALEADGASNSNLVDVFLPIWATKNTAHYFPVNPGSLAVVAYHKWKPVETMTMPKKPPFPACFDRSWTTLWNETSLPTMIFFSGTTLEQQFIREKTGDNLQTVTQKWRLVTFCFFVWFFGGELTSRFVAFWSRWISPSDMELSHGTPSRHAGTLLSRWVSELPREWCDMNLLIPWAGYDSPKNWDTSELTKISELPKSWYSQ